MKLKMFAIIGALCAVSVSAEVKQNEFTGSVGGYVACIAQNVSLSGPVNLQVQTLEAQNKVMVSIHGRLKLEGADASGNVYRSSFQMNANFDAKSTQYVMPYSSVFIGQGNAQNFKMEGDMKVFVDATGKPVGAWILTGAITCQN